MKMSREERFARFLYGAHNAARERYCNKPKGKVPFDKLSVNQKNAWMQMANEAMSWMNSKKVMK